LGSRSAPFAPEFGVRTCLGWANVSRVGTVLALTIVLYASVLIDLAHDWWTDPSASYGMLIPPVAVLIAWMVRKETLSNPAESDSRGLLLIGCACLIYLLGKFGAEFFLQRMSFVILLFGLVWTYWGARRTRSLLFPFVLLATMVPLPAIVFNALSGSLQLYVSDVATTLAQGIGIAVYRDGNIINLAKISLGVSEACSGLNSLLSMTVASLLLGFLHCRSTWTRCLLFSFSVPLSIAVNVLRITGTAVLADHDEEFALGFYHLFSGWLIFLFGFLILYAFSLGIRRFLE
jgi:exosortase